MLFATEMSDLGVQIHIDISWEDWGQDYEADRGVFPYYPTCLNLLCFFFENESICVMSFKINGDKTINCELK